MFQAILFTLIAGFMPTVSEDRALIVGISEFPGKAINAYLPGIDKDIERAETFCKLLGFKTRTLHNITANDFRLAIDDYLRQGRRGGRTLIYLSTHGSRLPDRYGDELDEFDEVLLFYDSAVIDGKAQNILVDDEFRMILDELPGNENFVIIDACNSGTAAKSFTFHSKKKVAKSMPLDALLPTHAPFQARGRDRFASLAASQDDQETYATSDGSLLTLAILQQVELAARSGRHITLRQLRDYAEGFIREHEEESYAHQPQLDANQRLWEVNLFADSDGRTAKQALVLKDEVRENLYLNTNQSSFALGETLEISTRLPEDGYLNVVGKDAHGQITLLFPNRSQPDNYLPGGWHTIPGPAMDFRLIAGRPLGETQIRVFFTRERLDLYHVFGRDDAFASIDDAQLEAALDGAVYTVGEKTVTIR